MLSAAAHYPPGKMHFKLLRAYSRRLPSHAPASASEHQHRQPPPPCAGCRGHTARSGSEPREPRLCSGHAWLLPSAAAWPLSPGDKRAGGKGKLCLHRVSQRQQSPTGSPLHWVPPKRLPTSGNWDREMLVPPRDRQRRKGCIPLPSAESASPSLEMKLWGLPWFGSSSDGGGCGGSCPLRAQERESGALRGTHSDNDIARWMAFSNERILRPGAGHGDSPAMLRGLVPQHSQQILRAQQLVKKPLNKQTTTTTKKNPNQ